MSTLVIEKRRFGVLWLVHYTTPSDEKGTDIAEFVSKKAADIYRDSVSKSMGFAREVGRSGLG